MTVRTLVPDNPGGLERARYRIPAGLNGWWLVAVCARITAAVGGETPFIRLHNSSGEAVWMSPAATAIAGLSTVEVTWGLTGTPYASAAAGAQAIPLYPTEVLAEDTIRINFSDAASVAVTQFVLTFSNSQRLDIVL